VVIQVTGSFTGCPLADPSRSHDEGAGAGGIATAARLAKAGLSVTVLEKNDFSGGRCSLMRTEEGYRFDQGPSLLLLPNMFRETFVDLDTSLEAEGVELLQCHPNYHIWFSDGEQFQSSTDTAAMKRQVERWEGPGGFQRYLAWLAEAHGHYHLSVQHVLHRNFSHLLQLADPRFVWPALKLHPLESIWSRASRYFWTERLRRVFTFATMYMGMSPFDAPSTYSLLQYTELAEGIWYPRGGFHVVLEKLVQVGERLGVKYRFNAPVARILSESDGDSAIEDSTELRGGDDGASNKVKGVMLESGEMLAADIVVVNADLVYAYNQLLPQTPGITSYAKSLESRDASCSSISFYWSLRTKVPELGTHNIFLADEYRESFDAIFKRHSLPDCPSFYINVPSRIDPSAAPAGCDAVIALVPVGHLVNRPSDAGAKAGETPVTPEDQDWPALVAKARATVLEIVQARTGCAPLAPLIADERVNDPLTWQDKFNLDRGAILGLSHNFFNVLAFRPGTRARGLTGAYFVGASTHPGTGVPIVLAGAKITTEQVLGDMGVTDVPWTPAKVVADREAGVSARGKVDETGSKLDRVRRPWWVYDTSLMIAGVVMVLAWLVLALATGRMQGFGSRVSL
jgi:phytoene desaturase (3,4-didehydrolycopene-forming)